MIGALVSTGQANTIPAPSFPEDAPMVVAGGAIGAQSESGTLSQADMMSLMLKDLEDAMCEELSESTNRVVNRMFVRLADNIANVEANIVANTWTS